MDFFKNKNCIITGGAGLIGSYLSEELVRLGANVFIVDDLSKGRLDNLESIRGRYEFIEQNLESESCLTFLPKDCDYFFHLASRAYGIGYSENNHYKILNHNELITNTVLKYLSHCKLLGALFTSSSCVYPDDGPDLMLENSVFQGEPEAANYGYGWAKRILEKKVEIFKLSCQYPIAVVRPLNIYGERYTWQGNSSQAIPMIVKKVMESRDRVVVWGSGSQRRNYLHAKDCAIMMINIVVSGHNGIVNIGTEETISLNELSALVISKAKLQLDIVNDLSKPEGRYIKSSDSTRLRSILGNNFNIEVNLNQGIELMLAWYKNSFR
jgi:nucleoside-diphosphate-sugar epimerase